MSPYARKREVSRISESWRALIVAVSFCLFSVSPAFSQSFSTPTLFTVGLNTAPTAVAVGDFNGDGIPDLVVANRGTNNMSVLLGNGDGTFQAPINTAVGTQPSALAVGDFNVDGKLDVAVANTSDGTVSILLGNGDGTFTTAHTYTVGNSPVAITFNHCLTDLPSEPCLAVVNQGDDTISIMPGKTDASFFVASTVATGNTPASIASGDFDGDGNIDLVVANNADATVSVFLGDGHGDFASAISTNTDATKTTFPPGSLAVGDFNGDGKPDVAVVSPDKVSGAVTVLLGIGGGKFSISASYPISGTLPTPVSVAVADFNLDGKLDLVVADLNGGMVSVLLGNGDGTFQTPVNFSTGGFSSIWVAAADLNGDGRPDIAVTNQSSGNLSVLLNLNTPLGLSILVQPLDKTTNTSPVTFTFSDVTQAGLTTLSTSSTGPAPPTGFALGNPPTYYNINTTAAFSGTISICVNYSAVSFVNPANLHLFHYENGSWVDVTTSLNTVNSTICGTVTSLSPFLVAEAQYAAQIQQPINADGSSVFSASRGVVPVKFALTLANVPTCNLPPASIVVTRLSGSSPGTVDETVYEMAADSGTSFRISSCQYVYNLAAKGLGPGTYEVDIVIGPQVAGSGFFALQ